MTRKLSMMTVAAAAVALAWVAVGQAQERGGPPWGERVRRFGPAGPGEPAFGRLPEELALSDEQRAQLAELRKKQRGAILPLVDSARDAHETFRAALESESPDATAVGQAAIAMKAAEKRVRAAHDAALEEMKAILTPEQREQLELARERGPRGARGRPRP